jgi:hypothetical protein
MFRYCILQVIVCAALTSVAAQPVRSEEKSTSKEAIKAAVALLEAKKANAAAKADEDRIAVAIDGLLKLLNEKPAAGAANEARLTPQMLKKLGAKYANFDAKSGELALTYDFSNKDQLKDFDAGGDKLTTVRTAVQLEAGQEMTHVVKFKSVIVAGTVASTNMPGDYVSTTGGIRAGYRPLVGSHTRAFLVVNDKGTDTTQILSDSLVNRQLEFRLTVTPKRVSLRLGGQDIGLAVEGADVGQVKLRAPSGKTLFGKLTLTGVPNPKWVADFFAK